MKVTVVLDEIPVTEPLAHASPFANAKAQADLRFPEVLRALEARCRTDPGKQRALARPFLADLSAVHDALALVDEARRLQAEPLALPLQGVSEIRPQVFRAAKGAMLEPQELVAVTHALFSFERIREALEARREALPALSSIGRRLSDLDRLATQLDRCFEASGEISDRASPELREARDRSRGLHRSIRTRLDRMLADERFAANLREGYYSVRNDRYVVPVDVQHRSQVPGIVHNASQSGQTLFVEPQDLIALGNELAIAQSLVLEEERRILLRLSQAVGRASQAIGDGVEACAQLDEAEAAARLANDLDASPPALVAADGPLALKAVRHPLLALTHKEVVANDVVIRGPARALVVSGPNAGGKTVTLTAVGLCALMTRAGLHIPCDAGSQIPLFASVYSAVGDAQDLTQGLSTFSAHVTALSSITSTAPRGSLVLVDEIAADTDPKEGAAIAIAVLEGLLDQGCLALVTTHLEELKALAHLDPRFVNARVGFDAKRLAPTYRLQLGAAGTSSAIEVAARVGLSEKLCARARELVAGSSGPLSHALAAADDAQRQAAEELEAAREAKAQAQRDRAELEQARAAFENARRGDEQKFREALTAELEFARGQIRALLDSLKQSATRKSAEQALGEVSERLLAQEQALRTLEPSPHAARGPSETFEARVGARAFHPGMGADVEILDVEGATATVAAGALRMKALVRELGPPRASRAVRRSASTAIERAANAAPQLLQAGLPTCDLRGQRADEAVRLLDAFLDGAFLEAQSSVLVIHGHGTGALKQVIRERLAQSPYVRDHRPGEPHEGGDGATVVFFRD